jgi:hypothetical protein
MVSSASNSSYRRNDSIRRQQRTQQVQRAQQQRPAHVEKPTDVAAQQPAIQERQQVDAQKQADNRRLQVQRGQELQKQRESSGAQPQTGSNKYQPAPSYDGPGTPAGPNQHDLPQGLENFGNTGRHESNPIEGQFQKSGPDEIAPIREVEANLKNQGAPGVSDLLPGANGGTAQGEEDVQRAAQGIAQQAENDPQLRKDLANIAGHPENGLYNGVDNVTNKYLQDGAAKSLEKLSPEGKAALDQDPSAVGDLGTGLENTELAGQSVSRVLGDMAAQGAPNATEMLREKTAQLDMNKTGVRAADALAEGEAHFREGDYQRIANGSTDGDGRARDTLRGAAERGDPQALKEIRGAIRGDSIGGAQVTPETQAGAIDALGHAGENFTKADGRLLESAAASGNAEIHRRSVDALKTATMGDPPADGAADSLGRAANESFLKRDDMGAPGVASQSYAEKALFDAYGDPKTTEAAKDQMSPYILKSPMAPENLAKDAVERSTRMAKEGNPLAVEGLEAAARNPKFQEHYGNDVAYAASQGLGEAAAGGNKDARGALNGMLRDSTGRWGGDGFFGAEGLKHAAKLGDEQSLKDLSANYDQHLKGKGDKSSFSESGKALGDLARDVDLGNKIGDQAREKVREGAKLGDQNALRDLGQLGDKASAADVKTLQDKLGDEKAGYTSRKALAEIAGAREDLRPGIIKDAQSKLSSENPRAQRDAVNLMGTQAEHLSADHVKDVQGLKDKLPNEVASAMTEVTARSENADARAQAARTFQDKALFDKLSPQSKQRVVDAAAYSGDKELKANIKDHLDTKAPLQNNNIKKFDERYRERLVNRIEGDMKRRRPELSQKPGDDSFARLGHLMSMEQMVAKDPKLAEFADTKAIADEKAKLLSSDTKTGREIAQMYRDEKQRAFGDQPGKDQADYLQSQDFRNRLLLSEGQERSKIIGEEVSKLAALDPKRAESVGNELKMQAAAMDAKERSGEIFNSLDPKVQESAMRASIDAHARGLPMDVQRELGMHPEGEEGGVGTKPVGVPATVADKVLGAMNKVDKRVWKKGARFASQVARKLSYEQVHAQQMLKGAYASNNAEEIAKWSGEVGALRKAGTFVKALQEKGTFGALASTASLVGTMMNGKPGNAREWTGAANDVAAFLGNAHGFTNLSKGMAASKAGRFLNKGATKALGPISSGVGAVLDTWDGINNLNKGDYHSAGGNFASATGGAMMVAAPFTGPAAPFLLVGGLAVSIGGQVYSAIKGWSSEMNYIHDYGMKAG